MYDDQFLEETLRRAFSDDQYYCVPRGIMRFDYGKAHGWWVRVTRDGAQFKQLFSDGPHGSIEGALRAAISFRHELLASFPVTLKQVHARSLPPEPENRIVRVEEKGKKQPYIAWKARWYDENHAVKNQSFSVKKFGEEGARALALAVARKNHNKVPKLTQVPDNYLTHECRQVLQSDVAILASISSGSSSGSGGKGSERPEFDDEPFAFEGERKLVLHRAIERDKKLRAAKLASFLDENGRLYCELCGFSFSETYPFLSKDIIEVHHVIPLSKLSEAVETKLDDLMLLCANCHFAIHQGDAEENLLMAIEYFEAVRTETGVAPAQEG
jgi:predicted HNH restriction endonuclease